MCYNAPAIVAAAKDRAGLIGAEIKREVAALKSQGKEHLFAGVIAGSETQISRDFETNRPLGFRALAHRGFSEKNPPKDRDAERVSVVKEWMELWANSLHAAGVPREKIFCHIAFTDQGLRKADAKESYAEKSRFRLARGGLQFRLPSGILDLPGGGDFQGDLRRAGRARVSRMDFRRGHQRVPHKHARRAHHGNLSGAGVQPRWRDGECFFLGHRRRGHAQQLFPPGHRESRGAWPPMRSSCGERPWWNAATGFSSEAFQDKMRRIQAELPDWVQKSGQQAQVMPLTQKLKALIKDKKWQEADKVADEILSVDFPWIRKINRITSGLGIYSPHSMRIGPFPTYRDESRATISGLLITSG